MPRTIKTRWSVEDGTRLRALASSGASIARISAALNRPMSGVRRKARELGIALQTVRQARARLRQIGISDGP